MITALNTITSAIINVDDAEQRTINSLKLGKLSVFCGAGISYNSGLPVASQFIEAVLKKFELSDHEKKFIHNSGYPFEAFIEILQQECNTDELLKIFGRGDYNTNHLFIAWLIKSKLMRNIITTNFDELIEQACSSLGLTENEDYSVYRTEDSFADINCSSAKVNLIKIHGCASDLKSMAINMEMVANRTNSVNKNAVIRHFFDRVSNPTVLILGYSCSDVFDISPAIESLQENTSEVILLEHIADPAEQRLEDIQVRVHKNPFNKFFGKRVFLPTDLFVKHMWNVSKYGPYELIKSTTSDWRASIDKWYSCTLTDNTEGFKHHICSRLFYNLGNYEASEQHYNQGITIAYRFGKHQTVASEIGNLAMNYNALGRYEEAKQATLTSLDIYRRIGDIQGELSRLQTLGNIYRNLGDYALAESTLLSSLQLAITDGKPFDVCTSLGNLALVYNLTEEYRKAINAAEEGLSIAHKLGVKQSEASQLSTLGIAYFSLGNPEKGIYCLTESIKITRLIKDRRNESMALVNLATFHMQILDFKNALTLLQEALPIAIELNTVQTQGMINFNMGECWLKLNEKQKSSIFFQKALHIFTDIYSENHDQVLLAKRKVSSLN
jgi:tetratricopeptide (TPR) repeat protein